MASLTSSFTPETEQQGFDDPAQRRRMRCLGLALTARFAPHAADADDVVETATVFLAFVEGRTGEAA